MEALRKFALSIMPNRLRVEPRKSSSLLGGRANLLVVADLRHVSSYLQVPKSIFRNGWGLTKR